MLPESFTVGWICALSLELAASRAMFDEEYEMEGISDHHDSNIYTGGKIAGHNVVMACLPAGKYGTESAATVAKDMLRTFSAVRFGLMVGIGGGVATKENDIRLGDVVVSRPTHEHGGVIQYDMGKARPDGTFERRGTLNKPPLVLLNALQKLQSTHQMRDPKLVDNLRRMAETFPKMSVEYSIPHNNKDVLFASECCHDLASSCGQCGKHEEVPRVPRLDGQGRTDSQPRIHYGLIGSGNRVIASARERDQMRTVANILCYEMEAAGLMDSFPCIVVRGICDYADSYKRDDWQRYAAATAAAYTRELLETVPASRVEDTMIARGVIQNHADLFQVYGKGQVQIGDRNYHY